MRTVAVLPVKELGEAKSRLAARFGAGSRQAIAQAMFLDVLATLRRVPEFDAIVVVTSDPTVQGAAREDHVVIDDTAGGGHSGAAVLGIRHALARGAESAMLVAGDTPLADAAEISDLIRRARAGRTAVSIVPDRHGTGTNALLLTLPPAIEPSFGPGSLARHMGMAEEAEVSHSVERLPSLLHDVDTPEDLAELAVALEGCRGRAPMTRGALSQLGRSGAGASGAGRAPREDRPQESRSVRVLGAVR